MLKPDSLRAALAASIVDDDGVRVLERDPEKLAVFIDKGRIAARPRRANGGLGYEWRYTLNVVLTDFQGSPDAVAVAVVLWLAVHQPEALADHQAGNSAVKFEADIIDAKTIDLALELELNEAVDVTPRAGGGFDLVHRPEPELCPPFDDVPETTPLQQLYVGDRLIIDTPPAP